MRKEVSGSHLLTSPLYHSPVDSSNLAALEAALGPEGLPIAAASLHVP